VKFIITSPQAHIMTVQRTTTTTKQAKRLQTRVNHRPQDAINAQFECFFVPLCLLRPDGHREIVLREKQNALEPIHITLS
jgi:hypothetical protein